MTEANSGRFPVVADVSSDSKITGEGARKIDTALKSAGKPDKYTPDAEAKLVCLVDDYTGRVGVRAVEIARERKASVVDVPHIEDAKIDIAVADGEVSAQKKVETAANVALLFSIAGMFVGAGVTAIVSVLLTPSKTAVAWWILAGAVVSVVVGVVLTYLSYRKSKL